MARLVSPSSSTCSLPGCHRPKNVRNGYTHDYCGRTCANQASSLGLSPSLQPPHGSCHTCQYPSCNRPVFYDKKKDIVHDFCGRSCARQAREEGLWIWNENAPKSTRPCGLPGCSQYVNVDPNDGVEYDFCSRRHALKARERNLVPPPNAFIERSFRGNGPLGYWTVNLMVNSHEKYAGVKQQFLSTWEKHDKGNNPTLVRIFQIFNPTQVNTAFEQYAESVGKGTVKRFFHGTSLGTGCHLGTNPGIGPCESDDCSVCGVCRRGFVMAKSQTNTQYLRYGKGMYFSPVSGKSNDYAQGSERVHANRRTRVMFLCKVAVGKTCRVTEEQISQAEVDKKLATHNSITGVAGPNLPLNFPETVVYANEAAIPSYLIVYYLT